MPTTPLPARAHLLIVARLAVCGLWVWAMWLCGGPLVTADISALNQHFNDSGKAISPWMFIPKADIKEFSTDEHRL